jgi:oligopeptidase A
MTYGSNNEYREKLYKAYTTRASENSILIDEILLLRDKKAKILGFENYAEYSIFKKDAKDVESVEVFLKDIAKKAKPIAHLEIKELEKFANEEINSINISYFSEKLRQNVYHFDEESCMSFFPKDRVVEFAMKFIETSFGVNIKHNSNVKTWHDSVKVYDFYENNECFGRIYLDLETRKSKKGGAWMHNFQSHHIDVNNIKQPASAFVVCNFMQTVEEQISLLKHSDITTLFHELGHAIHHIFSQVSESYLSGVNGVKWDVVECPSQFLEQFAYDKKVLKDMAEHYVTKEGISDELLQKIIKAKNFQASIGIIRQCEFSIFDILLHKQIYQKNSVQDLLDNIRKDYSVLIPPFYNKFQNSFSHIFAGGYASGYYSYKYAEVLSANLYIQNTKKTILKKYKDNILNKGSSENMTLMTKSIIGKEPTIDALFSLYGI